MIDTERIQAIKCYFFVGWFVLGHQLPSELLVCGNKSQGKRGERSFSMKGKDKLLLILPQLARDNSIHSAL
jgi:hypothetical protein